MNLDLRSAQHLRGSGDGLILLFRCDLTLALVVSGVDMAAVSDQSAEGLGAVCPDQFLDGVYRRLAGKRPDPVLARVDSHRTSTPAGNDLAMPTSSSDTASRLTRLASAARRSSFGRPTGGCAINRSSTPASAKTSASVKVAHVSPIAPWAI